MDALVHFTIFVSKWRQELYCLSLLPGQKIFSLNGLLRSTDMYIHNKESFQMAWDCEKTRAIF